MQRSIIRIILILCSLGSWLIPGTASASPGLTVSGALFEADVAPGENITHDIKISLSADKQPVTINLEVGGFRQNPDGTCNPVEANKDIYAYSACSFITLDTYTLRLNSGETRHVKASIRIPSDVSDGGKYAVIRLSNQPDDKKQLSVALSINIPILLTLSNSTPVHTGQVESINISKIFNHKPIELYTDYKNTGNHHYKIRGIMYIKDNSDKILATLYSSAGVNSILPAQLRRIKFSFIPTNSLPLGNYRVESVVISEDNQILAQKEIMLDITETYQPPVPIASIVVKPTSEATIKTSDEQISVTFPAGSVTAEADISLTLYSKEQLPEAAGSLKLGNTCFRIDGLTGLLTKKAKLTVKYTSYDLEQAGGNLSKLRLARWDEIANKWTVIDTVINEQSMTLTVQTNHFSLWSVMIDESAIDSGLIFSIVVCVSIFISIPAIILLVRKLRH